MPALRELFVLTSCLGLLLIYLWIEKTRLERARGRVGRRVAVTGTRGKSSVVRLVAAGLRASGLRVLAKTTGSKPILILPDGSEREIDRSGPPSVREQVRLVALAAGLGADAIVAEMMSIGPECLAAESRRILRPGILAVTNVRLDHRDEMGSDRAAIARALAAAVPERAEVFIPEEETDPAFVEAAAGRGSTVRPLPAAAAEGKPGWSGGPSLGDFEPNLRLARAVLGALGVDGRTIERGLAEAAPDPGSLRVWRVPSGRPPRETLCVSLFAANEPVSSAAGLARVKETIVLADRPLVGLLCLREDRGDRTLQWVRAARDGFFRGFASVLLIGPPARAALRRIGRRPESEGTAFSRSAAGPPRDLMDRIMASTPGAPVIVGLGNFVGPGEDLVRFWQREGVSHAR